MTSKLVSVITNASLSARSGCVPSSVSSCDGWSWCSLRFVIASVSNSCVIRVCILSSLARTKLLHEISLTSCSRLDHFEFRTSSDTSHIATSGHWTPRTYPSWDRKSFSSISILVKSIVHDPLERVCMYLLRWISAARVANLIPHRSRYRCVFCTLQRRSTSLVADSIPMTAADLHNAAALHHQICWASLTVRFPCRWPCCHPSVKGAGALGNLPSQVHAMVLAVCR